MHRGDGAGVQVPFLILWFGPQRCKSRNAHLRDFLNSGSTSSLTNYLVAVGAPAAQKLGRRSRQTRFHLGRFALSAS